MNAGEGAKVAEVAEVAEVVAVLVERGQSVGCAESLTGGLLTARFVDVPGASAVLRGGVVSYATELKHEVLGVSADLLAARGAVDPQVAAEMARGARRVLGADWGVATTGVAGPDPQDGMPVGLVYVAVAGPRGSGESDEVAGAISSAGLGVVEVREHRFAGDRAQVRAACVDAAVALLAELLRS